MGACRWIAETTRREFLKGLAGAAVATALPVPIAPARPASAAQQDGVRVVLVRDRNVLDERGRPVAGVLARMLDDGVAALAGVRDPAEAWRGLLSPDDTVGVKSNAWSYLPTPPELEEALVRRVRGVGIPSGRVSVDDRGVLGDPVFRESTALINVRPMRTHHWAGVGSCIKNYIMFSPDPPSWHEDSCADLGGLWDLPIVRGKTRLNVLVMLAPLFHGKGPHHFNARYLWRYHGIVVGRDPVAVDATGLAILQEMRRRHFGAEEPFAVPPKHIATAERKFGLGVADPARIRVEKVGWVEGALI